MELGWRIRIAIDSGGTFTDCVYVEDGALKVLKLFSTPRQPGEAVLDAVMRVTPDGANPEVRHGTTVGTSDGSKLVEIVNLRVRFAAKSEPVQLPSRETRPGSADQAMLKTRPIYFDGAWMSSPIYDRALLVAGDCFAGPALITEYTATTVLPPDCAASVDGFGNLVIEIEAEARFD